MRLLPRLTQNQIEELSGFAQATKDVKELKRVQAILLVNTNPDPSPIITLTGYSRSQIFSLRNQYVKKGLEALKTKAKGEPKRLLTPKQLQEVIDLLQTTSPREYGYQSQFWTTGILAGLIETRYAVKYRSKTSYYVIFRKSHFSFHLPGKVNANRDEAEVTAWAKATRPILEKAWKDPDTVILCEDEAILSTRTTFQKVWLPENDYPKVEMSSKRINRSLYGFLNLKNGQEKVFVYEWQNMYITVKALQQIRRTYPKNNNRGNMIKSKKILLLWDNAGWHKGSKVQEYLKKDGKIEVVYFPRYAPEENPQEHVWKKVKQEKIHNRLIEHIEPITQEVREYLNTHRFFYSLLGYSPVS